MVIREFKIIKKIIKYEYHNYWFAKIIYASMLNGANHHFSDIIMNYLHFRINIGNINVKTHIMKKSDWKQLYKDDIHKKMLSTPFNLNVYFNKVRFYHRVSIERKSPYKESYTVNSHCKMFSDVSQSKVA